MILHQLEEVMRTYGVICAGAGLLAFFGSAESPEDACTETLKGTIV